MKGGVFTDQTFSTDKAETDFIRFISQCRPPTQIGKGTFWVIYSCTLPNTATASAFKKITPGPDFGTNLTTLIVKMCIVRPMDEDNDYEFRTPIDLSSVS